MPRNGWKWLPGKFGIFIGIQNHGDMLRNADEVLKLVSLVDSPWLGVIVDTGYFLTPDPYADMAKVIPYAVNRQIKERLDGKDDQRRTDLKRLARIIKDSGYRGYLPIETLQITGEAYDPRARVAALLKALREALAQA